MAALYCNSLKAFYRIRDILTQQNIEFFEADIRPAERYLTERFITGPVSIETADNKTTIYNPRIKPDNYEPELKLMSVDIETTYDTANSYLSPISVAASNRY